MRTTLCLLFLLFLVAPAFAQKEAAATVATTEEKEQRPVIDFSLEGGFYSEEIEVALTCPGATIYYTLDGSLPDQTSAKYSDPISISKTTLVLAVARQDGRKSKVSGNTYFINEPASTFPVVSVGVTPSVLFDPETGLYIQGPKAVDSLWRKDGANFWSRKEILVHTEIYETDGQCEFNSMTGFRLFGGMSRLFPQKSMTLIARDDYGNKHFKHRIFGKEGLKEYKFLVLRNSGSDWGKSYFRDAFMTGLLRDWDIEIQDYRPAHVYINGEYWGIYNIREKINREYIAEHFDLEKDSIDLIEHKATLKQGSRTHYLRMLRYLDKHSLAEPANFAYIQSQMEVDNFMNYQIAQIYFDNQDAGGNIKYWRPQTPTGRWRWIMYDTDWGFGLHSSKAYQNNSLAFHTEPDGPSWPNPPWSTFILRKLLENPRFEMEFVNRFADHLNTTFEATQVNGEIDQYYRQLKPEMQRQLDRWNLSATTWKQQIRVMKEFALNRPDYVRSHLMEKFDTGEPGQLKATTTSGGHLLLNDNIQIKEQAFAGLYFEKIPIHIKAVPDYGYRFVRWEGIDTDDDNYELSLYVDKDKPLNLRAVFERHLHPLAGKIIFNEISANNKAAGDWVEIFNNSDQTVNLADWVFTDKKHEFIFPQVVLDPDSYLILCEDSLAFRKEFPGLSNVVVGDFHFGLNKRKESLALYTNEGASIDSVGYNLEPMDTIFTLALLLPQLDNSDAENWEVLKGPGTPDSPNPYYLESRIRAEQGLWVRIGVGLGLLLCSLLVLHMRRQNKKGQLFLQTSGVTFEVVNNTEKPEPESNENEEELPPSLLP